VKGNEGRTFEEGRNENGGRRRVGLFCVSGRGDTGVGRENDGGHTYTYPKYEYLAYRRRHVRFRRVDVETF